MCLLNHEMFTVVVHPQIQTLYFPPVCCAFCASRLFCFLFASRVKCHLAPSLFMRWLLVYFRLCRSYFRCVVLILQFVFPVTTTCFMVLISCFLILEVLLLLVLPTLFFVLCSFSLSLDYPHVSPVSS